jgi:hypothetical protein
MISRDSPTTYLTDIDFIARCIFAKYRGWNNRRKSKSRSSKRGSFDEISSFHKIIIYFFLITCNLASEFIFSLKENCFLLDFMLKLTSWDRWII